MALTITVIMFAFMSPIKRCTTKPLAIVETEGQTSPIYVADVLINRRIISDSPSHLSYGSDNTLSQVLSDSPSSVQTWINYLNLFLNVLVIYSSDPKSCWPNRSGFGILKFENAGFFEYFVQSFFIHETYLLFNCDDVLKLNSWLC